MEENVTSNYDIYNRANDVGKATDIQSEDLFYMQRGTGSDRDKCIKGSDILASTSLVSATTGDTNPRHLIQKLDNGGDIAFDDVTVAGIKKIKADLKTNTVDKDHLKSGAVTTAKIADGAVTYDKMAEASVGNTTLINGAVTTSKLENGAVSEDKLQTDSVSTAKIKNGNVKASKLSTNIIDFMDSHVEADGIDQSARTFAKKVRTYSGVDPYGIIDVTVDLKSAIGYGTDVGFEDLAFELRTSGSSTAVASFDIRKIDGDYGHDSTRFVVKNGANLTTYELYITGKWNDNTQHSVTPTIGDVKSTGIIFN